MADQKLAAILGGFEALSRMIDEFIAAYEQDHLGSEVLFGLVRAKHCSDQAAELIRKHLRR